MGSDAMPVMLVMLGVASGIAAWKIAKWWTSDRVSDRRACGMSLGRYYVTAAVTEEAIYVMVADGGSPLEHRLELKDGKCKLKVSENDGAVIDWNTAKVLYDGYKGST